MKLGGSSENSDQGIPIRAGDGRDLEMLGAFLRHREWWPDETR